MVKENGSKWRRNVALCRENFDWLASSRLVPQESIDHVLTRLREGRKGSLVGAKS